MEPEPEREPDDETPVLQSTRLPPVTAAALRSSLDDHQSRAQELREALDQLRAELDGERRRPRTEPPRPAVAPAGRRPPSRPWSGRGRHLVLGVAAGVVVLAAVVGVVRVVSWSMAGPAQPAGTAASASRTPTASTGTGTHPAAPASPSGPAAAAPVLPRGLPASGPGADAPGAELTAFVAARGEVDVYERLVVRPGTTSVRLSAAPSAVLPRGLRRLKISVTGLQVAVDGRPVAPRVDHAGWRVTPADAAPFTHVAVHYRLSGAAVRTSPAPPGRVTLVLRPLTGPEAAAAQDPVVVRLRDRRVSGVYCPSSPQPVCATSRGAQHVATVPAGGRPVVLAQITLR